MIKKYSKKKKKVTGRAVGMAIGAGIGAVGTAIVPVTARLPILTGGLAGQAVGSLFDRKKKKKRSKRRKR